MSAMLQKLIGQLQEDNRRLSARLAAVEDRQKHIELQYVEVCRDNHRLRTEQANPNERVFEWGSTYNRPLLFVDSKGRIWAGPSGREENLHFATFDGFMSDGVTPVWVLRSSALPEDCRPISGYTRIIPLPSATERR